MSLLCLAFLLFFVGFVGLFWRFLAYIGLIRILWACLALYGVFWFSLFFYVLQQLLVFRFGILWTTLIGLLFSLASSEILGHFYMFCSYLSSYTLFFRYQFTLFLFFFARFMSVLEVIGFYCLVWSFQPLSVCQCFWLYQLWTIWFILWLFIQQLTFISYLGLYNRHCNISTDLAFSAFGCVFFHIVRISPTILLEFYVSFFDLVAFLQLQQEAFPFIF